MKFILVRQKDLQAIENQLNIFRKKYMGRYTLKNLSLDDKNKFDEYDKRYNEKFR